MNLFRKLRWKLTLNYTIVTVSVFLVVILILVGVVLPRIFLQTNIVDPEGLLRILQKNNGPLISHILSQSPVDTELINILLNGSDDQITSFDFLRIGSVQLTVRTMATFRFLVIGVDGILLGKTENGFPANFVIGEPFDLKQVQGLEAPFNAALANAKDISRLYTIYEPNKRYVLAIPVTKKPVRVKTRLWGSLWYLSIMFPPRRMFPRTS
jgi:hypothetical protein